MTTELERMSAMVPETMKTARFIKDVSEQNGSPGQQLHFRLNPGLPEQKYNFDTRECVEVGKHENVVVSAVVVMFLGRPETMIFPADEEGRVTSWGELAVEHHLEHETVLKNLGYEIIRD